MRSSMLVLALTAVALSLGVVLRPEAEAPLAETQLAETPAPAETTFSTERTVEPEAPSVDATVRCLGFEPALAEGEHRLWPMGAPPASETTRLQLELDYPSGGIALLEDFESSLTTFTDDRGTDLASEPGVMGPFWPSWEVAEDQRSVTFVVHSDTRPHPDATSLHLAGAVVVTVAGGKRTASAEPILRVGETFTLGPYDIEIVTVGDHEWLDGWHLGIHGTTPEPAFGAEWRLEDEAGEPIEILGSMSTFDSDYWEEHFSVDPPIESGRIVLEYWDSPRRVMVPFDVTFELSEK